jgi:hypothetical protein
MRTITKTLYTLAELPEEIQEQIIERERERFYRSGDLPWQKEIIDSLLAVFEKARIKVTRCEIGCYSYSDIHFAMDENVKHLKGKRAIAWLENNLLAQLREPVRPIAFRHPKRDVPLRKQRQSYYTVPGAIRDCPLTGYCPDETYLDSLKKDLREGVTLRDAFANLADVARKLLEDEYEYQSSDEYLRENLEENEYTEDGREA